MLRAGRRAASFLLLAGAPLMLLIAAAVKLGSPGPVLFSQRRCGLHGRQFEMLKFRAMVPEAETMKKEPAAYNEVSGPVFKMRRRPPRHPPRALPAPHRPRRAAPAHRRPAGRDEPGRPAAPPVPEEVEQYDS